MKKTCKWTKDHTMCKWAKDHIIDILQPVLLPIIIIAGNWGYADPFKWSMVITESVVSIFAWEIFRWCFVFPLCNDIYQPVKTDIFRLETGMINKLKGLKAFEDIKHILDIKGNKILTDYYRTKIDKTNIDVKGWAEGDTITIENKLVFYDYIIFAAKNFDSSICSVDCNIDAWENIREVEDLQKAGESLIDENTLKVTRDTDSTYKIFDSINKNIAGKQTGGPFVLRIFYVEKRENQLTKKEQSILYRLYTHEIAGKIAVQNRILFSTDITDDESKEKINKLQDIIIFDDNIAFKEYHLYNKQSGTKQKSEITIDTATINSYKEVFMTLFTKSKRLHEIELKDIQPTS
jgi:hypothetical protein